MLDLPHGAVITKLLAQGPAFAGLSRFPSLALTDWLITGGQPALRGRLLQWTQEMLCVLIEILGRATLG